MSLITRIKQLFSPLNTVDLQSIIDKGAMIIDVRSKDEYNANHLKNSINIPLTDLDGRIAELNMDSVIITCCASGARSNAAKIMLQLRGFKEIYNGGSWQRLKMYTN